MGTQNDMEQVYRKASVYALISKFEALPLSIIEAMSAGLPVIATDIGGVPELIKNNDSGLLVGPGNLDEISAAIDRIGDPALRERLSLAARARYESMFSEDIMLGKIAALYDA